MSLDKMFAEYAETLKRIPNVTSLHEKGAEKDTWVFEGAEPKALRVELYRWHKGADFIGIDVEGVDCAYWNTPEVDSLDYHIELAIAALSGDVERNRSPILRREEVCFRVGDAWECTLTDKADSFHYIKTRKKLKGV